MKMFDAFNRLEGELREEKYPESEKTVRYIQTFYAKLADQLKIDIDSAEINKFGFLIVRLKSKILDRDESGIQGAYISLQRFFLDIMEYYDYPHSPVLIIFDRYIDEAREGLETKNFLEVSEEMEELRELREYGEKGFLATGADATEVYNFFTLVEKVQQDADEERMTQTAAGLDQLHETVRKLLAAPQ